MKKTIETFSDGIATICKTTERAITETKLKDIRFGDRTIGVTRYWQAQTAGSKVDRLIAVPIEVGDVCQIDTNDIVIVEHARQTAIVGQYQVKQVQQKADTTPPTLYITLSRLVHAYKDTRTDK